jgi:tetratricopeptide (TPR) repeat protein
VQNIERKRHDLALEDLSQAISIDPEMPEAYYHRAMAQVALNDPDAAQKDLEQAIRLDAGYAEPYVLRATLSEKAGAMEAATADFRKALELDPFAEEARAGFERVSGETAVSVAAPLGEPVSGWSVYAPAAGRFVAVHERYPKLRVFLEMHGEGQAQVLEWTPLRDALNGIGLLRYRAGSVQGQPYEYVAILDLNASKVVAIEPYLWGNAARRGNGPRMPSPSPIRRQLQASTN